MPTPSDLDGDFHADLLPKAFTYVKTYMSHYDGSHDYAHILRVLGLAHALRAQDTVRYDEMTTTLAALFHDVGDKKYLLPGQDSATLVRDVLLSLGAAASLAENVQTIVSAVSYSSEIKDPQRVVDVIARFPELEIVQDADRLDAIGAVGIGRTFTFGGAKGARGMDGTLEHFEEKLERLEGMMKTEMGKQMAAARTERLKAFRGMWEEEAGEAETGLKSLGETVLR